MRFVYKAKKDGKIYEGSTEARNRFEVYQNLKAEGAKLISLKRADAGIFSFEYWNEKLSTVPEHEIILFADNMATMLSAGLSLSRALQVTAKQTKNMKFQKVISKLNHAVSTGDTLFSALAKQKGVFNDIFISMVRSGELSGNLPQSLKSVAKQLDRIYTLKKKIKGAMIYPSIILFAIFGVGVFMMTTVVPSLAKTFKEMDAELPASTKFVMYISDLLSEHFIIMGLLGLAFIVASVMFLRTEKGAWFKSKLFLTIPLIKNLTREINAAYAARTLSSLLKSGVDIVESSRIAADVVQNRYFKESLKKIADDLQKGRTFTESLRDFENLYPIMFVELMAVGEETGSSSDMMTKVADYYEEEVNEKTKNMSTIVEPFLMLFIGVAVGFFALAMMTPMYSITQSM